jgi:hypothetical protein
MVYKTVIWMLLTFCIISVFGCQDMAHKPNIEATQQAGTAAEKQSARQTLYVGWASADITPQQPVALVGQMRKRISQSVLDPLTATVLALETRGENGKREQAIMVSCDVAFIKKPIQERLRVLIKHKLPGFDADKLFMNATHTHTAPGFIDGAFYGLYDVSQDEGVMKASEYASFFLECVSEAVVEAWRSRQPSGMSWALGHAVVGLNRRAHYFDGSTVMYGSTRKDNFSNIEGYEDHGVEMLFFWGPDKALTGIVINLACPSQETEGLSVVSADFWHDTRKEIRDRLSDDVFIFPQCAAAGDISPHRMFREKAEDVMRERRGLSWRQEIARRIANAVEDGLVSAKSEIQTNTILKHVVVRIDLPEHEPSSLLFYETDSVKPIEFHVIRLGDIALATNPFEMYLDYGIRIKARSKAVLTFMVQLSCQASGYLPTKKAIRGGGYSADKFIVGPAGGQVLVDETVKRINAMWD